MPPPKKLVDRPASVRLLAHDSSDCDTVKCLRVVVIITGARASFRECIFGLVVIRALKPAMTANGFSSRAQRVVMRKVITRPGCQISGECKISVAQRNFRLDNVDRRWWEGRPESNLGCERRESRYLSVTHKRFEALAQNRFDQLVAREARDEFQRSSPLSLTYAPFDSLMHLGPGVGPFAELREQEFPQKRVEAWGIIFG